MEDVAISAVISAKEKRPTYLLVFFPTFQPTEETKIMPIFKILPMDSIQEHRQNCKPKIQEMEKDMGGTRIQMEQKGWLRQTLLRNTRFLFFFW